MVEFIVALQEWEQEMLETNRTDQAAKVTATEEVKKHSNLILKTSITLAITEVATAGVLLMC